MSPMSRGDSRGDARNNGSVQCDTRRVELSSTQFTFDLRHNMDGFHGNWRLESGKVQAQLLQAKKHTTGMTCMASSFRSHIVEFCGYSS